MRLFVSYAHENSAIVQPVVDVLRAATHFVWFDDQILPGQDWKHELPACSSRLLNYLFL
jgi:hypothetical protein